jgi:hypothetical protein
MDMNDQTLPTNEESNIVYDASDFDNDEDRHAALIQLLGCNSKGDDEEEDNGVEHAISRNRHECKRSRDDSKSFAFFQDGSVSSGHVQKSNRTHAASIYIPAVIPASNSLTQCHLHCPIFMWGLGIRKIVCVWKVSLIAVVAVL